MSSVGDPSQSVSSTPTMSTVSMSEASFDLLSDSEPRGNEFETQRGMITIRERTSITSTAPESTNPNVELQVQSTSFEVPRMILARNSAHFAEILSGKGSDYELAINDSDVSSQAFSCLLRLIYPIEFGISLKFDTTQWSDVLHLADKWNFPAVRAAAIEAIFPLASPVDRIVLGRKYGLDDWMPSAFEELLVREAHITKDEGDRLGMGTMVALASGRVDARCFNGIKSRAEICDLIVELTGKMATSAKNTSEASGSDHVPSPGSAEPVKLILVHRQNTTMATEQDSCGLVMKWMDLSQGQQQIAYQKCIVRYLLDFPSQAPTVIAAILKKTLTRGSLQWYEHFDVSTQTRNWHISGYERPTVNQPWYYLVNGLGRDVLHDHILAAWAKIIQNGDSLSELAVEPESLAGLRSRLCQDSFTACSDDFRSLVELVQGLYYLEEQYIYKHELMTAVSTQLWRGMITLFDRLEGSSLPQGSTQAELQATVIINLIRLFRGFLVTNRACVEIEDFFVHVEQVQEGERTRWGDNESVKAYQKLMDARPWPTD